MKIDEAASQFEIRTIRDADDRLDLRYGVRNPRAGSEPSEYVVFLNGRTEWIEKYCYLPLDLKLPESCGFLTWDHRGQGASGGARAFVETYEDFARDAQIIVDEVVGNKPYSIVAHSMGGLIALYATLKGYLRPKRMVLSSPLLGLPEAPVPTSIGKPLSELLSRMGMGTWSSGVGKFVNASFKGNRLTHNFELYERMRQTPYPCPGASFGWVHATFAAKAVCFDPQMIKNLTAPTLVIGGSQESVVNAARFSAWVQQAAQHSSADVSLYMIQGSRHELFSEAPEFYQAAIAATREWLKI